MFRAPELSSQPVRRCPNHAAPTDPWNEGHPAPLHLVRCDHQAHRYVVDEESRRLSVLAPFEPPASVFLTIFFNSHPLPICCLLESLMHLPNPSVLFH